MTELALVIGALLAVAAVVALARPLLGAGGSSDKLSQGVGPDLEALALAEERDRALAALRELEFDHRTGKVSDADYRLLVPELRRRAADALRALDRGTGEGMATPAPPQVPEPSPEPHVPPAPPQIPEPSPEPSPPAPPPPPQVPEPGPEPSPPAPSPARPQ